MRMNVNQIWSQICHIGGCLKIVVSDSDSEIIYFVEWEYVHFTLLHWREPKNFAFGFRVASSWVDLNCNRAPQVQGRAEGHIHFSLLWRRAWIVERRDSRTTDWRL
jgi:hypothetical protein